MKEQNFLKRILREKIIYLSFEIEFEQWLYIFCLYTVYTSTHINVDLFVLLL